MSNPAFEQKAKRLLSVHPDARETLMDAHNKGLTLSPEAVHEITRLGAPEIAYFLAEPKNQEYATKVHGMTPHAQVVEIGRLAKELNETGQPFDPETDDYLDKRRKDRREGNRR